MIGTVLDDRYRIEAHLGEGAMGVVYRATDISLGRPVAVKLLNEDVGAAGGQLRQRFEREARALFALEHPHIVAVSDFGIVEGKPYLVMELLRGRTLESLLAEGPLDPRRGLALAKQVISALAFAHAQGIVHRDLKSANVVLVEPGGSIGVDHTKLLDFGLVKFVDAERWGAGTGLTTRGDVFGSPGMMPPEQWLGQPTDARADVYSAGVLLFELLTGVWPFMEDSREKMLRAHLMNPPPALALARPELDPHPVLERIVATALAKRMNDRFPDCGAMLQSLESVPPEQAFLVSRGRAEMAAPPVPAYGMPPPPVAMAMPTPVAPIHPDPYSAPMPHDVRMAPMYGGPPVARSRLPLYILLLFAAFGLIALAAALLVLT